MARRRLDAELVRRDLASSRQRARELIVDRKVLVGGSFALKPARMVDPGDSIEVIDEGPTYVSRAGHKLAAALEAFDINPDGLHCLDAGASTGGFTDCLLQRGARSVVAVDVGTNQLHENILSDPRVDSREQTDVRSLHPSDFPHRFDLVVGDLSFISLRLIVGGLADLVEADGRLVLLIKPQFEAGRQEASRGRGIISDPEIWRRVIGEVVDEAESAGLGLAGIVASPVAGAGGNIEFPVLLRPGVPTLDDRDGIIDRCIDQSLSR